MARFFMLSMVFILIASSGDASASEAEQDLRAAAAGNTSFACDLYTQLKGSGGNLFFSPFSISVALGMTYAGAKGETEMQVARVMHFELPRERMHSAMGALISSQSGRLLPAGPGESGQRKPAYELALANSIWLAKERKLVPSFASTTSKQYGSPVFPADFRNDTEGSRIAINAWVSEKTESRIPDLLKEKMITASTPLVLVNAIWFKSPWLVPFDASMTGSAPFTLATGRKIDVPTMTKNSTCGFFDAGGFSCVSIPYAGNELSMLVLVPKSASSLPEVESSLRPEGVDSWVSSMKDERLELSLPRFRIDSGFELSETLKKMGMPLAFSDGADFSGMVEGEPVKIGLVVHQSFVSVDEEGTEAAAATAVSMKPTGMPKKGREFRVDRPFVFMIRDNRTGSVLFLGRVTNPAE